VNDNDNGGYKYANEDGIAKDKPLPGIRAKINDAKRSLKYAKRALARIERQNKRLENLRRQATLIWEKVGNARDEQEKRY